jgi:predicted kinase
MKPLRLSLPHVIVMVGIPGSGKSFFAEHFAETFSAPLVSSIAIRHMLVQTPSFSVSEQAAVKRISHHLLDELLKTNQTIVVDIPSDSRTDRMEITRKAKLASYQVLFVWVQTESAAARSRATKTSKDRSFALTDEQYDSFVKHFTIPSGTEKPIVISGKHTYASQLKIVLSRLVLAKTSQEIPIRERPVIDQSHRIIMR